MNEPGAEPPATPAPRSRRGGHGLLWLVVLAVLAGGGYMGWQAWSAQQQERQREAATAQLESELLQRVEQLESALETQRRQLRALETRASDNAATNQVLREELLGMGERAALLEDAVGRLADNRVRGEVMLRLNEAEFLLLMGEERLRLFGDVGSAVQAFGLADAALAGIDDPLLATLRQTLAQELLALRSVPEDPRPMLRAELARAIERLAQLPPSRAGEVVAADASDSRLVQLLSGLVTIRRVDARDAVLGPVQHETTLAALRLQLEQATAALARPDPRAYAHALERAQALAARLFDAGDAEVVALRATLERLRTTTLVPELPVLGATLQELRGLRATRSVAGSEAPAPVPLQAIAEPVAPEPAAPASEPDGESQ